MTQANRVWAWLAAMGLQAPEGDGTVLMRHRDGLDIVIEARPDMPFAQAYVAVAELAHAAAAERSSVVDSCLRWNLSPAARQGATLGLHRASGRIILSHAFDPDRLSGGDFAALLLRVVDAARIVKAALDAVSRVRKEETTTSWDGINAIRV